MIVQSTIAQVWWIALADEIRPYRGIDSSMIGTGLQNLFKFPAIPNEVKDGSAEFLNGKFSDGDDEIIVARLAAFNDGLNIHVPTNTDDAELVLQKALAFLFSLGIRQPTTPPMHFYQSIIVADFDCSLDALVPASLRRRISQSHAYRGHTQFMSINMNDDPSSILDARVRGLNPSMFKLERRSDVPYATNRYFSAAHMHTNDHINILAEFESLAEKLAE